MLPGGAATACESQKVPGVAGILTGVVAPCQVRVRASTVVFCFTIVIFFSLIILVSCLFSTRVKNG